ncbi:MAG TPA: sugar ABC transporter permease [Galbitalea sp.]|jgi:ABC-type sugar transport system permease subunit
MTKTNTPALRAGSLRPTGPARSSDRAGRSRRGAVSQRRAAWTFLAPSLLVLAVFVVYPIGQALYLSFTNYSVLTPPEWAGLDNYVKLFSDPAAGNAIANTLIYASATTVASVVLALLIAVFLNRRFPLRGFARTAIFLPYITSLGVVSIAWSYLLNPDIGLLSYWGRVVGIPVRTGWLVDPNLAMVAVILVGIWKFLGFYVVMYLAGIQSIPSDLYEAAAIDGAGPVRRFVSVTWPLLSNQTLFIAVIATITNAQAFDQIYVMTRGGPFFKTETLVMMMYRVGFQDLDFGYASALAYVLVALLAVLSLAQVRFFSRRAVQY